jgi:hypothetical protein
LVDHDLFGSLSVAQPGHQIVGDDFVFEHHQVENLDLQVRVVGKVLLVAFAVVFTSLRGRGAGELMPL